MDYFKGSVDAPRSVLIDRWIALYDRPEKGNALWTLDHFYDSVDDGRYVCLDLARYKAFIEDHTQYRVSVCYHGRGCSLVA